jgi:secreted PhoX family phosphatase
MKEPERAGGPPAQAVARVKLDRRRLLKGGAALTVSLALPGCVRSSPSAGALLAAHRGDGIRVAPGYDWDVILRWGDPLFEGAPELDAGAVLSGGLLRADPADAERQFGYNCDAVHFFPIGDEADRGIVCVNHEFTNEELFLPGLENLESANPTRLEAVVRAHPQVVRLTQAMHGISVTVIERDAAGQWRHVPGTRYARRITASTPCEIMGPARGNRLLRTTADPEGVRVLGTVANCAGGRTPWGTFLSAEENIDYYFGNAGALERASPELREAYRRLGPWRVSRHAWDLVDTRFDAGAEPAECLRFGWVVEIDPYEPASPPRKRTALGRFMHEAATPAMTRDGRVAVYLGDDRKFEYVYKFVTAGRVHPADRAANRDLLDTGTLYVARFDDDGTGSWLPLVHGRGPLVAANGFEDQGDVVIKARAAADLLGATPMDRPEDIAADGASGRVFVMLTKNPDRSAAPARAIVAGREVDVGTDAANPRGPNPYGHIVEIVERDADTASEAFDWRIFAKGGETPSGDAFGSPDNVALDAAGRLWVVTDGDQPGGGNDGCFVIPTSGPGAGSAHQVLAAPIGSEVCGCEFTADGTSLLLTIQHPGEGGKLVQQLSNWPDGPGHAPRPSLIALRRQDGQPL